jgi:hypothetical protein
MSRSDRCRWCWWWWCCCCCRAPSVGMRNGMLVWYCVDQSRARHWGPAEKLSTGTQGRGTAHTHSCKWCLGAVSLGKVCAFTLFHYEHLF